MNEALPFFLVRDGVLRAQGNAELLAYPLHVLLGRLEHVKAVQHHELDDATRNGISTYFLEDVRENTPRNWFG